jgi:L-ascorbate metabolism protein UlaG (beta-lactamase superfamily)
MAWEPGDEQGEIGFRFLGNAGFQVFAQGQSLAVDPFFTRPPFRRQYWGRVTPDRALAAECLPRCDHVLVTCARWDHLMDVPAVVAHTGARAYGPPRVRELLRVLGAPEERIERLAVGQQLQLGPFGIEVLPADHGWTPHDWFLNGPLPRDLTPPLRLRDYRMANRYDNLSFRISVCGIRLWLRGICPLPADVALISPLLGRPTQVRAPA